MPKRKKSAEDADVPAKASAPAKKQAAATKRPAIPAKKPVDTVMMFAWALVAVLLGTNAFTYVSAHSASRPTATNAAAASDSKAADAAGDEPDYTGQFKIVNAHEHLYREQDLDKYLQAAEKMDVAQTLFVASSEFTFQGKQGDPKKGNDENTRVIAQCALKYPGKIIPFATLHPDAEKKEELLTEYIKLGVRGLKLYTGHSNFHDRPLNTPEMEPVYAFCEKNNFPILWHINFDTYFDEFLKVMEAHPHLKVIVPHYGVAFFRPGGPNWKQMTDVLDKYPSIYVDCSYGTRDILVMGLQHVDQKPDTFRKFFEQYQDRIVWGTDMVVTGNEEKSAAWIESVLRASRDWLEKREYHFWMAAKGCKYAGKNNNNPYGKLRGLALPPEILKKVYETNIQHFLDMKAS